jgi:hypothetical protein
VVLRLLYVGRVGMRGDLAEEAERPCLEPALAARLSALEGLSADLPGVCEVTR